MGKRYTGVGYITGRELTVDTNMKATLVGDYSYALVMGGAMVAAALAIMLIGKEEAEEKLILPVKK